MEHHVFRDLAPAYMDGLTSKETNEEMQNHMDQCEACQNYLNEMKDDLRLESEMERKKDKKNIDYFKKVRTKNRRKIVMIVSSIISVFLILIAAYYFMFVDMRLADATHVETDIQNQDRTVTLTWKSKRDNHYLLMDEKWNSGYVDSVFVYEMRDDFSTSAKLLKDGISITYSFLDENTLLLDNGEKKKLTDEDKIQIQYKNSIEEIPLKDLYGMTGHN
jgi:hypothetical protein